MMRATVTALPSDAFLSRSLGAEQIHVKLFSGMTGEAQADNEIESSVTITLSGADHHLTTMRGSSVLEAALGSDRDRRK